MPHLIFCRIPVHNFNLCWLKHLLISVVDVGPMNPYQPIPFHILSFVVFQSRILIYDGSNISDEIAEEKKYMRGIWIVSEIDQCKRTCILKKPSHQTL